MAHRGLTSVPWHEVQRWSHARREAALIAVGESEGGRWDYRSWTMDWPKPI